MKRKFGFLTRNVVPRQCSPQVVRLYIYIYIYMFKTYFYVCILYIYIYIEREREREKERERELAGSYIYYQISNRVFD